MVQVGPMTLIRWVRHYFALAAYTLLHSVAGGWAASSDSWHLRRWAAAWAAGSGHEDTRSTAASTDAAATDLTTGA